MPLVARLPSFSQIYSLACKTGQSGFDKELFVTAVAFLKRRVVDFDGGLLSLCPVCVLALQ